MCYFMSAYEEYSIEDDSKLTMIASSRNVQNSKFCHTLISSRNVQHIVLVCDEYRSTTVEDEARQ